ncbi:MAG: hypothetical protein BGO51_27365 [Rhodospirillales bacterium 69-11]|nr:FkbM family methyltransferase [Rhodospirillales bacterium]MBN8930267.1 FkbM family methyltransferase [Rhodospirillales bacterium]OJW19091.1 MAG: hypothetical protein BGO51_27365 [Rhodospirillales bacterium 69-11]
MDATIERPQEAEVEQRGRRFAHASHPVIRAAAAEFSSGFEAGTLRFFDVALPHCDRFVDFGAYVGFTSLYAATHGVEVTAFEPNPHSFALLRANLAANPDLAPRIRARAQGVGARDEAVTLYAKGAVDSGASVFQDVERAVLVRGAPTATVQLRDAAAVLTEIGVDRRTLVKIDIEGAEYAVLPALGALLSARKPWLHVSFHPFNLPPGADAYADTIMRLRAGLEVAELLAGYRFMHLFADGFWTTIGSVERMDFLRHYLLRPKKVARIASPQYGFVDAVAFSEVPLPANA